MRAGQIGAAAAAGLLLALCTGCLVPQPRGEGTLQHIVEPVTQRGYYLYLPKDYVRADEAARTAQRWPLVVTFHGMKPYDIAYYQAREWQQEADRYGYIVVAPELVSFDFFVGEFPLRTLNKTFKTDEVAALAIMDHVFASTHADPGHVLSTSWSSGGYMAHYMLNRHPDRFTCLAVRQSNFTANVLDSGATANSRYTPVLVLGAANDILVCKTETRAAIQWYEGHGYKNLAWLWINHIGHVRTPDTAAYFFARVCGARANRAPDVLTHRQAIDGNPAGLALLAGKPEQIAPRPMAAAAADDAARGRATHPRPIVAQAAPELVSPPPEPEPAPAVPEPEPAAAPQAAHTARGAAPPARTTPRVSIRVSAAVGFEPLLLSYAAECPSDWLRKGEFAWYLDGRLIGRGVNGQRNLPRAGEYVLELVIGAPGGGEYHADRTIRVLKNATPAAGGTAPLPARAAPR
jgi:poly(3-hydroxybutyrate) depolymerase